MEAKRDEVTPEAKLWNIIYGFAPTLVLKCAVQLDLATIIHSHGASMTLSELSQHLPNQPVNENALYRIMRYLVHMKLFIETLSNGEIAYELAPTAKFLVKGQEKCMISAILGNADKDFMAPWYHLEEGLSSGSGTAFEKALGMDVWRYMAEQPEKNKMFNEAMANNTRLIMSALVSESKSTFDGVNTLVDVGGGIGTAVMSIAQAFPHIKCTVYDLPHVIAEAPHNASGVEFKEGDMFEYVPNADAIMLKSVLHDWEDIECVKILKKCKEAVPREGGKVIIVGIVLNAESEHPYTKTRLNLDMLMMLFRGKERTEEEWKKLILDAGYRGYKITHLSAIPSVIEAYPY